MTVQGLWREVALAGIAIVLAAIAPLTAQAQADDTSDSVNRVASRLNAAGSIAASYRVSGFVLWHRAETFCGATATAAI
jgi:hypothetical protein